MKVMTDSDVEEIKALTQLLKVLCDGIVIPNNIKYQIRNIENMERDTGVDYTDLKKCCMSESTIREAKDFKPYIKPILERIALIGNITPERQEVFSNR